MPNNEKPNTDTVYVCPVCGKIYERRKNSNMKCLVMHSVGDCCHFNEQEITDKILFVKIEK